MLGEVMPSVYVVISEHMAAMQPEAHAQMAAELSKVCRRESPRIRISQDTNLPGDGVCACYLRSLWKTVRPFLQ